jgi:hypothetical protein
MHCARFAICTDSHRERRELTPSLQICFPDDSALEQGVNHEIPTISEAGFCRLINT